MENEDREKEAYRLWWEYLKENADYEKFCKQARRIQGKRTSPADRSKIIEQTIISIKVPSNAKDREAIISKAMKEKKRGDYFNYELFGDVHKTKFESWWKRGDLQAFKESHSGGKHPPVSDVATQENFKEIRSLAQTICDNVSQQIKQENKQRIQQNKYGQWGAIHINPSLSADRVLGIVDKTLNIFFAEHYLFLKINAFHYTRKELIKEIERLIADKQTDPKIKRMKSLFRLKERITRKKKGGSGPDDWEAILDTYRKYKSKKPPSDETAIAKKIRQAKRIIENVGQGIFPGDYQDKPRPKKSK